MKRFWCNLHLLQFECLIHRINMFDFVRNVRECLHEENSHRREFHTDISFLISYRVYMMTGLFHSSLFEGTLHVDKMHVWFKIANITHALPDPVYRQTDFTPKRVVVSCLHDTVARFRTGVKFSPRYKNRGELAPGWLAPAWNLWCYHVNKYRAMRGNRSELAPGRKSTRCHVNTPLVLRKPRTRNCPRLWI